MEFETDPKDSRRTTVIFETAEELNRAQMIGGIGVRILSYFGLSSENFDTIPIPGAVADEEGRVLPSRTRTSIYNKRLLNTANYLLKQSADFSYKYYREGRSRAADQAFGQAINNQFGNPVVRSGLQIAEADAS